MVDMLNAMDIQLSRMDITRVDRLNYNIRLRPTDGSAPRHITVKISEPW
jgi:hypothetical protein